MKTCFISGKLGDEKTMSWKVGYPVCEPADDIAYALNCDMQYSFRAPRELFEQYDAYLIEGTMTPHKEEQPWHELIHWLKQKYPSKPIFYHQEAELNWFQKLGFDRMAEHLKMISIPDVYIALNEKDAEYIKLFRDKPVISCPTLIDLDRMQKLIINYSLKDKILCCGASFDERAGGLNGYRFCRKYFPDYTIWKFSRSSHDDRELIKDNKIKEIYKDEFRCLKYLTQEDWWQEMSYTYLGYHLMEIYVGGRNSLAFAALGVPLFASQNLDIQKRCFPDLAVDVYDIKTIKLISEKLLSDEEYYKAVSEEAMKEVNYFSVKEGIPRIREQFRYLGYNT